MAQAAAESVAFGELEPNDIKQASAVPHPVEPCIRSSGVTDIGIFPEKEDARVVVSKKDFQLGGKYHCSNFTSYASPKPFRACDADNKKNGAIVKLFIQYQTSGTWTTATGWLVRDDLVVTAAHCTLNDGRHATCIRVYIGYSASSGGAGASSESQRCVIRIALPFAWSDAMVEQSEMAFLQLDKPFQGVTPIKYGTPEIKAQQQLTIIGYPTDLGSKPGGERFHIDIRREIDPEQTRKNMLMYQGDTQGRLSGAPIIRDDDFVAIG